MEFLVLETVLRKMIGHSYKIKNNLNKNFKIVTKKSKRNEFRASQWPLSNLLKKYSDSCTLHGVHYVFREDASFMERIAWLSIVFLCFICASLLVNTMWVRYSLAPTVTVVEDTHLPLHEFPFPAVSICHNNKIKSTAAIEYISRFVDTTDPVILEQVLHFLKALSLFQHPYYSRMFEHLKSCKDILPKLEDLNITDLMIKVLPECQELFLECSWHGKPRNCCDLFSIQRSEEGFCYSFNSMTSVKLFQCDSKIKDFHNFGLYGFRTYADKNCMLRRNTAAGTATGIEVFIKQADLNEGLPGQDEVTGPSGVRVQVHHVTEYPEAGMGFLVPAMHNLKMSLIIKPYLTESTHAIRRLSIHERHCYFADEKVLQISKSYTEKSCLIECRLQYLQEVCGCRPYYFNMLDNRGHACNSTELQCIADHSAEVRFFSPPSDVLRGFEGTELFSPLNCTDCLPTCHESMYDVDSDLKIDSMPLSHTSHGYLDIYYKSEGAVKYQRDVTFGWVDLLVSFGGIAGLFLGFSLLSIVEFIYWMIKIFCYLIQSKQYVKNKIFLQELTMNHRIFKQEKKTKK